MRTKVLFTIIALGFLAGCGKNNATSKPQLKYKSVNTRVLNRHEQLTFTLEVTDAEGDLQDTIWVQKIVKNCSTSEGTEAYLLPGGIPPSKDLTGKIQVCYTYGIVTGGCPAIIEPKCPGRNDSATYRFWMQDNAKNKSDTVTSDPILIMQ